MGESLDDKFAAVPFEGTSSTIEKPYVRLHISSDEQPDPSTIRPEHVLHKSLMSIIQKEEDGELSYDSLWEQYMSICQDMRIQGIVSSFAVRVRESMAMSALRARIRGEHGLQRLDMQTFSDCLLHLSALYNINQGQPRELEFSVYRFLFWSALALARPEEAPHANVAAAAISNRRDQLMVRHAFRIQAAVNTGDYVTYFRLFMQDFFTFRPSRSFVPTSQCLCTPSTKSCVDAGSWTGYRHRRLRSGTSMRLCSSPPSETGLIKQSSRHTSENTYIHSPSRLFSLLPPLYFFFAVAGSRHLILPLSNCAILLLDKAQSAIQHLQTLVYLF